MTLVIHLLRERGLERDLRPATLRSYETLIGRLGVLDREVASVTREEVLEAVWRIQSVNTRRSTVIALRSVFGWDLKVPRGVPRRYALPSETTIRLALSLSPHQIRGELMAFAGLRVGESCAITRRDVQGDRLTVHQQVSEVTRQLAPVKSVEGSVVIPWWLAARLETLDGTEQPASVRESLRRAGKKVGIVLAPHMLRHYYITTLIERGVALELVRKQARHSHISVTLSHYQEYDPQTIHDIFG